MSNENIAFELIVNAGNARSLAYEAIMASEEGDFKKAEELIVQADEAFVEAHHIQTKLIQGEIKGEKTDINLLLIHSQDHLMTAQSEKNLAKYIINLNKKVLELEKKIK